MPAAGLVDVEQAVRSLDSEVSLPLTEVETMARFLLRAGAVASSNGEGLRINVRRLARCEAAAQIGAETARAVMGNLHDLDEALRLATARDVITVDHLHRHPRVAAA